MEISQKGIDLIKSFEGCKLNAYPDPATGGEPITIGYGHTGGVKMGDVISWHQAEELLKHDLEKFVIAVNFMVHVDQTQGQFDALVSFAYNCGTGNLQASTLLKMINAGSQEAAGAQLLRWNKAAGVVMPGLIRRRTAELNMYHSKPTI